MIETLCRIVLISVMESELGVYLEGSGYFSGAQSI